MNENELMHYGVLGMKWGVHRANKLSSKAAGSVSRSKELKKQGRTSEANREMAKAKKYKATSEKITKKSIERSGGTKAYEYNKNESLGKSIAKSSIMGTYGTLRYNELRSKNIVRGKAFIVGELANGINYATMNAASIIEPRLMEEKNKNLLKKYKII